MNFFTKAREDSLLFFFGMDLHLKMGCKQSCSIYLFLLEEELATLSFARLQPPCRGWISGTLFVTARRKLFHEGSMPPSTAAKGRHKKSHSSSPRWHAACKRQQGKANSISTTNYPLLTQTPKHSIQNKGIIIPFLLQLTAKIYANHQLTGSAYPQS